MENASKALVMAGGILIAIMVIATLVYAATTWGIIPQAKNDADAAKQLAEFNQQFESYARDGLYGTDLVSVLNKAIDNNEKYGVKSGEKMYVSIAFEINSDVDGEKNIYRMDLKGENAGEKRKIDSIPIPGRLRKGTYTFARESVAIKTFLNEFYGKTTQGNYKKDENGKYIEYIETISAASEFKTRIFKCVDLNDKKSSGIKYDDEGRVKSMSFLEVTPTQNSD